MGLLTILKKVKEEEREIRILVLGLDNAGKTTIVRRLCDRPIDEIEPTLGFSIQTLDYDLADRIDEDYGDECECECDEGDENRSNNNNNSDENEDDGENKNDSNNDSNVSIDVDIDTVRDDGSNCYKLHLWDVGGQSTIRAYWRNYFEKTDGIVWVVDSGDRLRLDLVREELAKVLLQERLAGASLLVLANKTDLEGALPKEKIAEGLGLGRKKGRTAHEQHARHWTIRESSAVTGEGLAGAMDWLVRDITDRIYFAA
uniref:ADP-ribosylation factor-like protein 2 n=1 Tax=Pseudo-nitzschia australis TaxID=44445 RepID=A0A7S4AUV7_9STRA|mmetsp:Transcript_7852/g.16842  ORF Transcript_7852/g.16842 Transcript_7852/m.16842 type:complete len:258 (-) Transcript_7852:1107-1880(-)